MPVKDISNNNVDETVKKINEYIGLRIMRSRLRMKSMTQKKLGKMVGVSPVQIARYEQGVQSISGARLTLIAKALDKPASYFIEGFFDWEYFASVEQKEQIKLLTNYFISIDIPELQEIILEHIRRISQATLSNNN